MAVPEGYFNIKQENELIALGTHFWCEGCLYARPIDDKSPDPRYCLGCYKVLSHETSLLHPRSRPRWIPRVTEKAKIGVQKVNKVSQDGVLNMATAKDEKSKVAIIQPQTLKVTRGRRGPKQKALPVELIKRWASQGMGYKRIAAQLKVEYDIEVGFRTVARIVKGERLLV